MGIFDGLASKLLRKRDASTLYVSINELPNPRDWGIVEFSVGERLIFSEELDLAAPTVDAIEVLIGQHWEAIQSSGYKRTSYDNVAPWVQQKIEAKLALGRLN